MGRGRIPPFAAPVARGFRSQGSGGGEEGFARRAGTGGAVRRLSVRARIRDFPHPRHQRHHRPAHRLRHRPQRLACHRQRPCAGDVGDGLAARRHRSAWRRFSRCTWEAGARSPGPSGWARGAFPFGAGVAGMSARCVQWLNLVKPTAFYGTPTYALHLAQIAAEEGLNPRDFRLKIMFFSGEPGASIPGVRGKIEELYGARVSDCGSMAEVTPWMNVAGTAETPGMLCWQDIVYTEVCDPATMRRVPYGARGTPVYTTSGADFAADDPAAVGRSFALDQRQEPLRPHLSAPAAGHLRPDRRHVHHPRRERVSERDRRGVERDRALRRRTSDH